MKTIQEVSEEFNVSKTTIRNYLKKLPQDLSLKKEKNIYKIDSDVETFLKDKVKRKNDNNSRIENYNILEMKINMFEKRNEEVTKDNEYLKRELNKKDKELEDLRILLKQQQRLQLDANKELLNYKEEE